MHNRIPIEVKNTVIDVKQAPTNNAGKAGEVDYTNAQEREAICACWKNAVEDFTLSAVIEIPEALRRVKLTAPTSSGVDAEVLLDTVIVDFNPIDDEGIFADPDWAPLVLIFVFYTGGVVPSGDAGFVNGVARAISAAIQAPIRVESGLPETGEDGFDVLAPEDEDSCWPLVSYILREHGYVSEHGIKPPTNNAL